MAEAGRNRTNLSTLPRRNNGFEDRGSHQTPFASSGRNGDDNIAARCYGTVIGGTGGDATVSGRPRHILPISASSEKMPGPNARTISDTSR
jgi:hypothetical protein